MSENKVAAWEVQGVSGQEALVHKHDAEGAITIDPVTGYIVTPQDERPEWAEDLMLAQMAERHQYYTNRLNTLYTDELKAPQVYAFEDLGWLGARELNEPFVNADGTTEEHETFSVEADEQHRMSVVAGIFGIEAELDAEGNETGNIKDALASVEIAEDTQRSPEELAELEQAQAAGFKAVNE